MQDRLETPMPNLVAETVEILLECISHIDLSCLIREHILPDILAREATARGLSTDNLNTLLERLSFHDIKTLIWTHIKKDILYREAILRGFVGPGDSG